VIVGAAVCSGAPFLVPGVADRLAAESADLLAAGRRAVRRLAWADRIVLIAAGRKHVARVYPPGTEVSASALGGRDAAGRCQPDYAVGSIVGRALLDRAFPAGAPAPVFTVETGDDPVATARAIVRQAGPGRLGVLVVADGAATHGGHAPGPHDDRAGPFDDALAAALTAGDPTALRRAAADRDLARQLLAVTDPLSVLAELTVADPPVAADLLYRGSPYGVGYLVASWRWSGP